MSSRAPLFSICFVLPAVGLLLAGCGVRTGLMVGDAGEGGSAIPASGTSDLGGSGGSKGVTSVSSGGDTTVASAGASASAGAAGAPSGGSRVMASGGGAGSPPKSSAGGASAVAGSIGGGAGSPAKSSAGGASAAASSSPPACAGVTCPALPKSCKKVVQDPTACCPVCTDSGCPTCYPPNCLAGMHLETSPGDCCPSCVADPPNACTKGQQTYADLRKALLDKYGSTLCQNSTECTLYFESNSCTTVCTVPLPTSRVGDYENNLASSAKSNCASCPPQGIVLCERMVAACLNGKCAAVNPP